MLGTDGSNCSQKAIREVATRPWPSGSIVKVISVREPIAPESAMAFDPALMNEMVERERCRAEDALTSARETFNRAGLKVCDLSGALFGEPRAVLLDEAKSWGADLVVVGSHGLRGVDRVLLGSVSEAVAMHAHCSVEVVHAKDGEQA